jgi:hypothetical protein
MGGPNQLRRVPPPTGRIVFDPFAKKESDCPPEVWNKNFDNALVLYCADCMDKYGLQAGKMVNRCADTCGICGKEGFVVGRMGAETDAIRMAQLCHFGDENQPGKDIEEVL